MAMIRCKECGANISTKANVCPNCGAKHVRTSGCAWIALIFFIFCAFIIALSQCTRDNSQNSSSATASTQPTKQVYTPPVSGTKSIISNISTSRNSSGSVVISGATLLPSGTKLLIEIRGESGKIAAQSEAFVDQTGKFSSRPFSDQGRTLKEGNYRIGIVSHFNGFWQQKAILDLVGKNGAKLPATALKPDDIEFPNEGRHLDEELVIPFPPIPEEIIAIDRVKSSKLRVQGHGQAVNTVEEIVDFFSKNPGFKPLAWSANKSDSKWIVTLDCVDGTARKKAKWEFDPKTGNIHYLDPLSKLLSWIPAE